MEKITKALQRVNLENLQNQSLTTQTSNNEITLYRGKLTKDGLAKGIAKILKAFPKFDKNQLDILKERFKASGFTDERVMDSINHVIDTYEGWDKLPNLANFIKFDKTEKLYTYNEMLTMINQGDSDVFKRSEVIEVDMKKFWKIK